MSIYIFLNKIRDHNGAIWIDNGKLKLSTPVAIQTKETKDFVLQNQHEIISILSKNQVFDKQDFINNPIFKTDNKETILSFAQERLWFIEQYEEGTNAYHIPLLYELDADTQPEGLKYAIQQIVSRHEVLRSTINQSQDAEVGIQLVHDNPLQIAERHIIEDNYLSHIKKDIDHPFDLNKEYPVRVTFYTIATEGASLAKTLLLINIHHVASDGWSIEILQKELVTYYEAYINKHAAFCLPPLAIQYKDYAVWQRSYLTGDTLAKQLNYWKDKLSGYQPLEFPVDYVRPAKIDYQGALHTFTINKEISEKLRLLAQRSGATLNSVMLGSINILLSKYTGQNDIVVGGVTANRHHQQTEGLIGFFVNTQANRTLLSDTQCFDDLIVQVHHDQVAAQLHQDLPFEKLIDELGVERDTSRHPVFQVLFGVQSFGSNEKTAVQLKKYLKPYAGDAIYAIEKFDLSIFIDDSCEELAGEISYATSLFHKDTIARLADHYLHLLEQLTESPDKAYSQVTLLKPEEYKRIVYDWNATGKVYPNDKTVHFLFEEQVKKTPDNIALVYENQRLSYAELNEKSNQLARYIRAQYLERTSRPLAADTFIAICMDRSPEMVIGTLAILKAGGAYVPIDPAYPQDRIDYILEDTQAALVLGQRNIHDGIQTRLPADKIIYIDLSEDIYQTEDRSNCSLPVRPANLAYLIYTSGTTGGPKGVMVTHGSVLSLVYNDYISVSDTDVFAFLSSPVFDAATFELFAPLLNGNKLIIPASIKDLFSDIKKFSDFLDSNEVSVLWLTKTLFESLYYLDSTLFKNLSYLIAGGEALDKSVVNNLVNNPMRPAHFLNGYGPTESTTFTCTYDMVSTIQGTAVPIGKPISNRNVYILSRDHTPTPIGITGELYIGGAGLARGYLNRPELTAERFVHNPFATETDKIRGNIRLYKTGDLVRWLPDGNIEYIGRNDDQVKIRGYRIELGEVEQALMQIEGVRQACVLTREVKTGTTTTKYLVGYYVPDSGNSPDQAAMLHQLSQRLPEYMLPAALVAMDTFPLTINGKLDKRALPDPEFNASATDYAEPVTETEKVVCELWKSILGLTRVGTTNDFFRLGGTSILAIQVSHRMSRALGCNVKVADIFKYKTIAQLLLHATGQSQLLIPAISGNTAVLSFAQERLWFIEQYEEGTNAYHIPAIYELGNDTEKDGIKYALQQIVSRHEVLRSTIEKGTEQGGSMQQVHHGPLSIDEINIVATDNYEALIKEDIDRPFDLSREYPIRARFYTINANVSSVRTLLLINIHHIASDGWSANIFENELAAHYEAYTSGNRAFSLPPLDIQYKDYAVWQRAHLTGDTLAKQLSYWKDKLSGYQPLEFPADYARPAEINYSGANHDFVIDTAISRKLRQLALQSGATLNSVMLSSINILLGKYTGQQDIVIGGVIANRHHQQTEGLIGFFVNTQVSRTTLSNTQSFSELIMQVHRDQVAAQLHQDLPFEKLVDELAVDRDVSRHPVFQILFELQSDGTENNILKQKEYLRPYLMDDANEPAKFDISIYITEREGELSGQINYATGLFSKDTIERLGGHYLNLLEQLTLEPGKCYNDFSLLGPGEHKQITGDWNATDREYIKDKTIYQLFEKQALRTPNSIAVVYEGQMMSYRELSERSNQVARRIRTQYKKATNTELEPGSLIALHLNRSLEMIIGIIAVLKAGGAYVPMDTSYPQDRIDYILEDTGAALILNQAELKETDEMYRFRERIINIALGGELYKEEDSSGMPQYSTAADLAYTIYTSGTTGRPKGVLITQRSVVNLTNFHNRRYAALSASLRVALVSNYIFDFSVQQIFNTILYGHTLYLIPAALVLHPAEFNAYLTTNKIEVFEITPVLFSHLILPFDNYDDSDLKLINIGGENLMANAVAEFFRKKLPPQFTVINTYGPTEYTVDATSYEINSASVPSGTQKSILIGKPMDNTRVYILDAGNCPVPVGVTGELHIGGAGLALGYLNRPELTAQRFIANPFATEADVANGYTRLYKTGDLVRWSADGNIEYVGRDDDQVKILGHRIELGEIEHALSQLEGIKQACVLVKERQTAIGTTKYLVGYYVAGEHGKTPDPATIADRLSKVLPDYMVPAFMISMESLPLTINGKLDKKALPDPEFNAPDADHAKPTTKLEKEVCGIWKEILGVDNIGITDNFFRTGGNSILAIQVSHRMSKALGCNVKVADVFKYKTISQMLTHVVSGSLLIMPRVNGHKAILSFAQERLWFIEQYEEGTNAYHIPLLYELDANTQPEGLKYAIQQIVSRHEVLRSTIDQSPDAEGGIQLVHDAPLQIAEEHIAEHSDLSQIKKDVNHPFDLSKEYPIRATFYTIAGASSARTLLLINIHHIASDGWSANIFEDELTAYYEAYVNGDITFDLPPLEIQYKDYAVWQRSYLTGDTLAKQLNYWKDKLSGYQPLEFPVDYVRPAKIDYQGALHTFTINKEISQKLRLLAQRSGATLNSVMLGSINILLSKYTGQNDIVVGGVTANRHHQQTEGLIGFFVNTQANRTLLSDTQCFDDLIVQVHHDQVAAQLHQDLPFEKLIDELGVERDTSRHPVFQVLFGVQSFGSNEKTAVRLKKHLKPYAGDAIYAIEKFDLSIFIDDSSEELAGEISYATSLFHKDTIARLADHYLHLLEQLTESPNKAYSQVTLLKPEEYKRIVYDWNATDKVYPHDKTIHFLFEEQVNRTPDNIALVYENQRLSYAQLNEKSNQLARHIRAQHLERTNRPLAADTFIAICMDRSPEMVIGTLAILKAGGAYVPIDPAYPQDRIDYILEDTQAALVLGQRNRYDEGQTRLPADKIIYIDLSEDIYQTEDHSNCSQPGSPANLAYLIYTSGTTGGPKGVMVTHGNVLSLVYNDYISVSDTDVFAFLSSPVFDAATFELFAPLLNGNRLIIPAAIKDLFSDIKKFSDFLVSNEVSVLWLTKTLFESLYYLDSTLFKNLSYLIVGGEALDKSVVNNLVNKPMRPAHFLNGYGPTESTTFTCTYDMVSTIQGIAVPIGKPISNRNVYILSRDHTPTPIGITGELYIGGAGLARGYLNRPELTAERFVHNPFATETDKIRGNIRLYKTGDLVRWLPDGNIEYIGRNDDQVKIRGYRIELGEVEQALMQMEGVRQACVLAREVKTETATTKYLVGYYVTDSGNSPDQAAMLHQLSQRLPEYMLPAALVAMDTFPLTINGKLDKRALPDPEFNASATDYAEPVTETEKVVCELWKSILGLTRVGTTNDFFRLGGTSILAIQVSHRMSRALGCNVKVADIFKYKTIAQLLIHATSQSQLVIPAISGDRAVLSFAQERLWFIEQYEEGTNAYHIPAIYELGNDTEKDGIKYALQQIVSRHEVLRSTIEKGTEQGGSMQQVHHGPLSIDEINIAATDNYEALIKENIDRPFDLSREYPIRARFYVIESASDPRQNKNLLLINIHHIASDGWSANIFEDELAAYYEAYTSGNRTFSLPPLDIQYKDYAVWQRANLTGDTLAKQLSYWKDKLSGYQPLEFPADYARPAEINYSGANHDFVIDTAISRKLRQLALQSGATLNSVMLSSINILLGKYTGQQDIVIGGVIANRHHQQTEGLIGFFVNTQVSRTALSNTQSFGELIMQVHRDQVAAQLHQDLPFEKLVDELAVDRDVSRHPVFQILFELQSDGQENNKLKRREYLRPYLMDDANEPAKFDISIYITEREGELSGQINYATGLFSKDTIERLGGHYLNLLEQLTQEPGKCYNDFSLLGPGEHKQITADWNATDREYIKDKTIYQLFEKQALRTPNAIAVVYEGQMMSYRELSERSNQVARRIRTQYKKATNTELEPGSLIALHLNRSLEMIIGIIAVLKAGGAYVPMDTSYPQDRIDYILEDTGAALILNQAELKETDEMYRFRERIINIALSGELYKEEDSSGMPQYSTAADLAYTIYTSGTTGRPKGVLITQRSVVNLTNFHNRRYAALSASLRVALVSNYIFDFSVQQIFNTILYGHTLYLIPAALVLHPAEFNAYLTTNKIEVFEITPVLFLHLILPFDNYDDSDLKLINIGGENLMANAVAEFFRKKLPPQFTVINTYGPTEYTVDATSYEINSASVPSGTQKSILIGKPMDNTRVYILDAGKCPVPVGVTGELHIGGAGLALGYLNRPKLTAQRFIANPFATEADVANGYTRLYKTGDLVRWSAGGNIEYVGRDDDQVKILGHRIELGEIEHALSQLEGIKQACVLVKERQTAIGTTKYLVGYYVAGEHGKTPDPATIADRLSKVLPDYMVPAFMISMESLPLTINGKLDKKALPDPEFNASDADHAKPETELELTLCAIYADILGLTSDQVSTQQNFFRMGGNSILSIRLKHKISQLDEF